MYKLKWRLCDDDGKEWTEEHNNMTLTDFEIVYGNNIYLIVWCELRMQK